MITEATRPLSLSELLVRSWQLLTQEPLLFIGIEVVLFVAVNLPTKLPLAPGWQLALSVGTGYLVGVPLMVLLYRAAAATARNEPTQFGGLLRGLGKYYLPALATFALFALFVSLAGMLLIIPGIYLAVGYGLTWVVFVLEDRRGRAALKRSRELVRGSWWRMFAVLIPGLPLAIVHKQSTESWFIFSSFIGDVIPLGLVTEPLTYAFQSVLLCQLYEDLKVRASLRSTEP